MLIIIKKFEPLLASFARFTTVVILGFFALGVFTTAQACPCGCVKVCVDNLAERPTAQAGAYTLDFRYDSINQDERSSGAATDWVATHRNLAATIETQLLGKTISITVPRIDRTLEVGGDTAKVVGLGDITISTRDTWNGYTVSAGLKLPTGKDNLNILFPIHYLNQLPIAPNLAWRQIFARRYLQPGTGSTDVLLGIRKDFGLATDNLTEFLQVQAQTAVISDIYFRPGTTLSLTAGLRHKLSESLALSLQGTLLRQYRDKNIQGTVDQAYAEDAETAGLEQIITAGISYKFNTTTNAYLFTSYPLHTSNYASDSAGGLVNPVHASATWSFGLIHTF